jgi:hypothetical protein
MDIHLLIITTRRQLVSFVTIVEPSWTGPNVSREFISQDRQMSRATYRNLKVIRLLLLLLGQELINQRGLPFSSSIDTRVGFFFLLVG